MCCSFKSRPDPLRIGQDAPVKPSQLEATVLGAVMARRSGHSSEDDRIEFKRQWPGSDKARQLAAAANRANGEPLIYVIGVDDKDGSVHALDDTDPAMWWQQMQKSFDDATPDLTSHLTITVAENEHVTALLFATDRAPYCITVANQGPLEREVPMREGSRTRSAYRRELLRLLLPSVHVPQVSVVKSELTLSPPDVYVGETGKATLILRTDLYFEHAGNDPVFLPSHRSSVELMSESRPTLRSIATFYHNATASTDIPFAPNPRPDGILLTGSGVASPWISWSVAREEYDSAGAVDEWILRFTFSVTGTERTARVETRLTGDDSRSPSGSETRKTSKWVASPE